MQAMELKVLLRMILVVQKVQKQQEKGGSERKQIGWQSRRSKERQLRLKRFVCSNKQLKNKLQRHLKRQQLGRLRMLRLSKMQMQEERRPISEEQMLRLGGIEVGGF